MTVSTHCWMDCATNWTIRTPGSATRGSRGASTVSPKLQHHRTFGYFLAVSKAKATAVPDHWIGVRPWPTRNASSPQTSRNGKAASSSCEPGPASGNTNCSANCASRPGPWLPDAGGRAVAALDLTGLADVAASGGYCAPASPATAC